MSATYTHTGRRAAVGYQHTGRDFNHYEKTRGRRHALNASGYRSYTAVCGVTVREDSNDCHDQGGINPIEVATVNPIVTCKQCLRRKPIAVAVPKRTKFAVMIETKDEPQVRWATDSSERNANLMVEQIVMSGRASVTQPPYYVVRAWVERVEE